MQAASLFERGLSRHRAGDLAGATRLYRELLELEPRHDQALFLLATLELAGGGISTAIELLERALQISEQVPYLANLGEAYRRAGRLQDAARILGRALEQKADFAEIHFNLGLTLERLDRLLPALAAFERAVELKPSLRAAQIALARMLWTVGRIDAALERYRRALELFPDDAALHQGVSFCLKDLGQLDEAIEHSRKALAGSGHDASYHSSLVYLMSFHPAYSDDDILREARRWEKLHAAAELDPHQRPRDPERRLRIGYLGPTFSDHIIGRLLQPVFERHDRERYEIHCYSDVAYPDERTDELRRLATSFRDTTACSNDELAELIRADGIDVLVDVNMHMADSRLRLLARKPAPVQMCWIAYPGTTGLTSIDYRISDPYLDPPGTDQHYAERTLRLPHCFWCYDPHTREPPAVTPLPALDSGNVTFGCLNNFCKINRGVIELWAEVLQSCPRSRLIVLAHPEGARSWFRGVLAEQGVDPARVEFVSFKPRAEYLASYQRIDIGLDTFPYNGHTTSIDSFWMGVPVVTLAGDTVAGRAGVCMAMNVGLPELIAATKAEFVQTALALAGDFGKLQQLRAGLRARMEASPLMDAPRFTRDLEALYRQAFRAWCGS